MPRTASTSVPLHPLLSERWSPRALDPQPKDRVLDLCAGTMDLAGAIEEAFPAARVVACDASAKTCST